MVADGGTILLCERPRLISRPCSMSFELGRCGSSKRKMSDEMIMSRPMWSRLALARRGLVFHRADVTCATARSGQSSTAAVHAAAAVDFQRCGERIARGAAQVSSTVRVVVECVVMRDDELKAFFLNFRGFVKLLSLSGICRAKEETDCDGAQERAFSGAAAPITHTRRLAA